MVRGQADTLGNSNQVVPSGFELLNGVRNNAVTDQGSKKDERDFLEVRCAYAVVSKKGWFREF